MSVSVVLFTVARSNNPSPSRCRCFAEEIFLVSRRHGQRGRAKNHGVHDAVMLMRYNTVFVVSRSVDIIFIPFAFDSGSDGCGGGKQTSRYKTHYLTVICLTFFLDQ
jgi:hypothetical protein